VAYGGAAECTHLVLTASAICSAGTAVLHGCSHRVPAAVQGAGCAVGEELGTGVDGWPHKPLQATDMWIGRTGQ
jgi:hypothetical protein